MRLVLAFSMFALGTAKMPRDIAVRQATEGPGPVSVVSSASPASTSSPAAIIIYTPVQMSTCQSANISWDYAGPVLAQLTLKLTDVNVNQSNTTTPPPIITQFLGSNINVTSENWTWQQVNVPSGYYVVEGLVNDNSMQTDPFFIANGSDTSCLDSEPSSSNTNPTSTLSPTTTSHKKAKVAAIVGGIIGGAIIIAVVLALLFLRKFSRPSRSRRIANNIRWAKFPSSDSQDPFARGKTSNKNSGQWSASGDNHISTESVSSDLNDIGAVAPTEPYSLEDEKVASASSTKPNASASVAPLPYDNHQTSASSSTSQPPHHNQPRLPLKRDSTNSVHLNPLPESCQHSSMDTLDARVERSPSGPSFPQPTYAPRKSSSEMIPLDRSASSRSTSVRRASRKPVPHYDASELGNSEVPVLNSEPGPATSLNHRSSLGNVHYLIPDMPPSNNF
jgi:hypothetical protein